MSIEKIERDLRQAIDDFHKYPASDDRCRGALLEFKATCSTENIRALLDELSWLRKALVDIRIELIHGEGDTYERITTCKEIVERALSEREGQE